jgi:hypothetical protein
MKDKYDFYQKIDARRSGLRAIAGVTIISLVVFTTAVVLMPIGGRIIAAIACTFVTGVGCCQWVPYIRAGGQWIIYIRDRVLHVDCPPNETSQSFEINIDAITEIKEWRNVTRIGDETYSSSSIRFCTNDEAFGFPLPTTQSVKRRALLRVLKQLRPDLPHNIGKNS